MQKSDSAIQICTAWRNMCNSHSSKTKTFFSYLYTTCSQSYVSVELQGTKPLSSFLFEAFTHKWY